MNSENEGNWRTEELSGSTLITDSKYISNKVKSTRYTLLTILPKNLFEQFQRSANIWFLTVSIFQLIPLDVNPVDSWTTVVPLAILLSLTLLKDAYNDYYRSKKDKTANLVNYTYWTGAKFDSIKCEDLLVGTVVLVYEEQKFPADIVVLGTKNGRKFFLDTAGINGCSDLMPKIAVGETHGLIQSLDKEYVLGRMAGVISFTQPNNDFNRFRGKLKLTGHPRAIDLPKECLAYRGSTLKGVEWVIGIVVYTGLETKTYLNIGLTKRKISKLERIVNNWTISLLGILLVLVVFSILAMSYLSVSKYDNSNYIANFMLFTILYNNIIPISLFVTMDMLRILQSFFITRRMDKMVDFNTSDVNENLGQIEYIFTDKTGSLTENDLKLKLCVIGNNRYFREDEDQDRGQTVIDDERPFFTRIVPEGSSKVHSKIDSSRTSVYTDRNSVPFSKMRHSLFKNDSSKLYQYVRCMVVNNSVSCEEENNYVGISKDEIAMVEACQEMGIKLCERTPKSVKIEFLGLTETYEVLAVSPFSFSTFKISILIKAQSEYILYTNGNYENIKGITEENSLDDLESQSQFACQQGYRNIFMSYKIIPESTAKDFAVKTENAKNNPVNSDVKIEILFKDLEKDSIFLGIAGIEDLVLPETIATIDILQKSGIKIWLLSGDNKINTTTTAKRVGLIKEDSSMVELSRCQTESKCINTMIKAIKQQFYNELSLDPRSSNTKKSKINQIYPIDINSEESLHLNENKHERRPTVNSSTQENHAEVMLAQNPLFKTSVKPDYSLSDVLDRDFFPSAINYSLTVDRQTFTAALESDDAKKLLCCLMFGAKSVVFFGLLPLDKANIVNLVKDNFSFRPVTLAIGEGNGDIPMIQAADVGVAVMNKSESQAKSYSDLAVTNFKQLQDLLLLHGRWNYSRMSRSVLLFLYKNCLLTVITFAYVFVSDFSGESIFDSSLIVGFNLGFTSLPILALGVFDEDLEVSKIFEFPELYVQGQLKMLFNWKKMIYYLFLSAMDGIIISLVLGYNRFSILNESGFGEDLSIIGTSLYIILVFTVLIQIALDTYSYSIRYVLSQAISLLILAGYIWFISVSSFSSEELLGTGTKITKSGISFLAIFIIPLVILALHQTYNQYSTVFRPNFFEKIASSNEYRAGAFQFTRLQTFVGSLSNLYRKTNFTKSSLEADAFELKKKSLHYYSEFIEAQYKEFYIYDYIKFYKTVIIMIFVLLILWTILSAAVFPSTIVYNIIRILMCAGFLVVVILIWTEFFLKNYTLLTFLIIAAGLIIKFASELAFSNPGALATGLVPAITYILFNVDFLKITFLNIFSLLLYTISLLIYYIRSADTQPFLEKLLNILSFLILNLSITITSAVLGYYLERTRRLEYKLMTVERLDVERSQRILSFLLPAFVKKRVKDGARYIAEDQGVVTVFFCDIVDFDLICNEYEPKELTAFLDSVFQKFDQICSAHGVTKIETVGKTYMACSGLKDSESELDQAIKDIPHARRAVDLGLDIIALSSTIRLKSGTQLQVKIGINSGPVTAGVVGYHKPQFSLVGDTVNTSSRMCSTLEQPNSIQISKECYDLIEQHSGLDFKENTIEAKGKGTMHTFIVSEAKNSSQESGNKNGFGRLGTLMNYSSFNRTMTEGARIKKKSSELLSTLEIKDGQLFNRTDTDILGKVKLIDFTCSETEKQMKYRTEKTQNDQVLMFCGAAVALGNFVLLLIISLVQYFAGSQKTVEVVIARGIIVAMLALICGIHSKIYTKRYFTFVMLFIFLCMIAMVLLDIIFKTKRDNDLIALEVMFIILLLNHTSQIPISKIIPAFLLIFIPWGVLGIFMSNDVSQHLANAIFVIIFAIINASALYTIETHLRAYFNLRGIAEKEISKTDKLLTQMMPPHVLENMRKDKATTDKFQDVTLLFADIVGFTAWSSNKTPREVVGMLSEMFTRFDKKCLDHHVYKVHTIGDCYVVMGITKDAERNPAEECFNVVQMAQSMIQIIKDVNRENGSELNMRIGIHVGEVIAGITGTNIVRYDIYGPDVMMANKMESGGLAGRINVSDAAMEVLQKFKPGMYEYEFNKEIYAKVINQKRNSYFIREAEKFDIKLDY